MREREKLGDARGNNFSVNFPLLSYRRRTEKWSQLWADIGECKWDRMEIEKVLISRFSRSKSSTRLISYFPRQENFPKQIMSRHLDSSPRDMATNFKQIKRLTSLKLSENWCCKLFPHSCRAFVKSIGENFLIGDGYQARMGLNDVN